MHYESVVRYLLRKLPIYQRKGVSAYKKDIGNIVKATKRLDNPQKKFRSIHIAGTNGKGSVAHMIASVLQEAGLKTGLYTSPHLKDFRERIKVNGKMISKKDVVTFVSNYKSIFEDLEMSFFEMTVAMAFNHFSKTQVDIAIIECGLGGRLDSTNIIKPIISVITNVGLDHTNLLGKTLDKIAKEKAGIIKENVPIIIGRNQQEIKKLFMSTAKSKNSPIYFTKNAERINTDLKGEYQKENYSTTLEIIKLLKKYGWKISEEQVQRGLNNVIKNTGLLGRWQILSEKPLTICDTAHNEDGIKSIIKQIKKINYNNLHFVFGTVNDKDIVRILNLLPKEAIYYFCKSNVPRSMNHTVLKAKAESVGLIGHCFSTVKKALEKAQAKAEKEDLIFITGSTFVVAEIV